MLNKRPKVLSNTSYYPQNAGLGECWSNLPTQVGGEGLELHILLRPHVDSIDLDPQAISGFDPVFILF